MPSNFSSFTVTWYDESDNYVTTADITADVTSIPIFTDTGSGEVNEAQLVIRAADGRYITSTSPVSIDKFDRIRIQCTDLGSNSYDRFFEIDSIVPSQSKTEGTILTLECLGIEYHTQRIHFAMPFWFRNAEDVSEKIGNNYNDNRGSRQPVLDRHDEDYSTANKYGNALPAFTINHYEYGLAEDTTYNRWMDVIDKMGGPVVGGGILDFFELGFDTPSINQIDMALFSSGGRSRAASDDANHVTVENTNSINVGEQEGGIDNPNGTVVNSWGADTGSLPIGHSKYESGLFQFLFRPEWVSTVSYKVDSKVQKDGKHYKSKVDPNLNNTPPASGDDANWERIDMSDEFGDSIQYSEWTDDKVELLANGGSDMEAVTIAAGTITSTGAGMFDGNIVIDNDNFFRTWVHTRTVGVAGVPSKSIDAEWDHSTGEYPRGFRVLADGTGIFAAGTKDPNGKTIEDCVAERRVKPGTDNSNQWYVKYAAKTENDRFQVAVLDEGKVYEWNDSGGTWDDISGSDLGNDCFHEFATMKNTTSFDPRPAETDSTEFPEITQDGLAFSSNIDSAIEIVWDFNTAFTDRVTNQTKYLSHGAWFSFMFPYPQRDAVSPYTYSEGVGDIYGGGTNEQSGQIATEPSTLDTTNLGFTPTGLTGFNETDSEALGELKSVSFALSMLIELRAPFGGTLSTLDGNANMRILMGDTADNVVFADFEQFNTDGTFEIKDIPLGSFSIYRAHKPRYIDLNSIADLVSPRQLDVQNLFEWRNIKWIVIQHQDQYDEFGRFAPEGQTNDLSNTSLTAALGGKITMKIDDFHFKKVLFATSSTVTTRNLESTFLQRPNIITYDQLQQDAKTQLEIDQFRHKEFNIATSGDSVFDIRFGDTFFLKNDNIVSDKDDSTAATENKIKLVAKRIEYHITKPLAGEGGLTRNINGVKRFT